MQLTPKNRYIQVERIVNDEEKSKGRGFVLPDDYKPPTKEYECYRVVSQAEDCSAHFRSGDLVAVENHMVKTLDFGGEKFLLVLENYVMASFNL